MRYCFRMEHGVDPKNIVGSIIKAARLLDCFTAERREVTLNEFASETGYNKTTTYRLLQTLASAGWLTRTPSGGYRLGVKLLYLGAIARADVDLRREALPLMRELAEEFGDTAFLMLPEREGAVVIEAIIGRNPVRVHGVTVGTVLPYHVAAGPVVLAAFNPEIEERVLAAPRRSLTSHTVTGKHDLRGRLAKIREQGYALSFEDYVDEVSAVAAPVMGPDDIAIGSLSLGGPAARFQDPELLTSMIKRVTEAAQDLTKRMGS
jgi:DNA-binding IclR family transcriptional regulator